MRYAAVVALAIIWPLSQAQAADSPDAAYVKMMTRNLQPLAGDYHNPAVGYGIAVPKGAKAWVALPTNPDRGVLIVMGKDRTIDIFGGADGHRYHNTHEYLTALMTLGPSGTVSLSKLTLGGQPAEQATQDGDGVHQHIVAQRLGARATATDFSLALTTDTAHLAEDEAIFAQIIAGFTRDPAKK